MGAIDQPRAANGEWGSGGSSKTGESKGSKDLHHAATRAEWNARPNRESLSKRLGKVAAQIKDRDHHECQYCKKKEPSVPPAKPQDKHHLDHLVPRVQGGTDAATNLVTACRSCNSARKEMSVKGWSAYARAKLGLSFSPGKIWKQAAKPLPKVG